MFAGALGQVEAGIHAVFTTRLHSLRATRETGERKRVLSVRVVTTGADWNILPFRPCLDYRHALLAYPPKPTNPLPLTRSPDSTHQR